MRTLLCLVLVLLLAGCVPIGGRWQNMMAEDRAAASV